MKTVEERCGETIAGDRVGVFGEFSGEPSGDEDQPRAPGVSPPRLRNKENWSFARWVRHLVVHGPRPGGDHIHAADPEFIEWFFFRARRVLKPYFGYQVRGIERVPDGPILMVGNHNAGLSFYEPVCFAPEWYEERGGGEVLHVLVHDVMLTFPLLGRILGALGGVRASNENTDALLEAGRKVVVFPGGNREAFRPFSMRNKIHFSGHTGFIRQALRHRVPMVPVVLLGGHRTFMVLTDGQPFAKFLRLSTILRSPTWPVFIGLPWGIGIGPLPHFPIPALTTVQVLDPIYPEKLGYTREDQDNPQALEALYELVVSKMQEAMDHMVVEQGRIRKRRRQGRRERWSRVLKLGSKRGKK